MIDVKKFNVPDIRAAAIEEPAKAPEGGKDSMLLERQEATSIAASSDGVLYKEAVG